ncbi:uncharacterized protein LAESUDRAFT_489044 [Laetiporus sulphureus 93-53]|uniref:Uncharacterized protein n=1 Tax=Laetiporus sulphureus 93-53 TaxID=1314785 RepID=A0A165BK32_9APHY|nr:uncharacterized protein LAESUDRAFT_489044 [Laetiporus sulphureus 93-53]KZT01204.1 hypothetical protein LAESUDRAFT_489044 [Laetiporus sulphureus 93-53]
MGWLTACGVSLLAACATQGAYLAEQVPLRTNSEFNGQVEPSFTLPWDEPVSKDATGNLIFQSLASLMQMGANSRYPNGHSIVRASIPPGTVFSHGRSTDAFPEMDWIALDSEHSQGFARGNNGTLFTFSAARELKLVYFDGCSGNKMAGVIDTQHLLVWGEIEHKYNSTGMFGERELIVEACKWGEEYGIDGFVRMEINFEIMYCNFSRGLELVSAINIINRGGIGGGPGGGPGGGRGDRPGSGGDERPADPPERPPRGGPGGPPGGSDRPGGPGSPPDGPDAPPGRPGEPGGPQRPGRSPTTPPQGWKGTMPLTMRDEGMRAAAWHNAFPGDLRVHVDPSGMISFFDPTFTSLIDSRRSLPREQYRLLNISEADIAAARADIADVFSRSPNAGSGVDWRGLAQVVQDRFSDRLPYLRYLLHQEVANATAHAAEVRQQLITSLLPYMPRAEVGSPGWFGEIARGCRASFTERLPTARFTKQERLLRNAVDEVLHEVCRVLTMAWREAFDVEEQNVEVVEGLLEKWRDQVDALIDWLDWPAWLECNPACGVDEFCYVRQHSRFGRGDDGNGDRLPRCVPMAHAFGSGLLPRA